MTPLDPDKVPELAHLSYAVTDAVHEMILRQERWVQQNLLAQQHDEQRAARQAAVQRLRQCCKRTPIMHVTEWVYRYRGFLRPTFGMLFVMAVGLLVASCVAAQQAAGPKVVLIDERLVFSWRIVLMAVVAAVGYGGVAWSVAAHHKNTVIHLSVTDIERDFPRRAECALRHEVLCEDLHEIKADLKDIKGRLK